MVNDSTTANRRGERRKLSGANVSGLSCIEERAASKVLNRQVCGGGLGLPRQYFAWRFYYYCGVVVIVICLLLYSL